MDAPSPLAASRAERFGRTVKSRRDVLLLTQAEVTAAGGPSGPTLRKIESGRSDRPSNRTLRKLDHVLRWESGSASRTWVGQEPVALDDDPPTQPVRPLVAGPHEMALTVRDITDALNLAREHADALADQRTRGEIVPALVTVNDAINRYVSRVFGRYATMLLELNGGPGIELHPYVEVGFGHYLDRPIDPDNSPAEVEEYLYRRWLANRPVQIDPETEASFRTRWKGQQ